MDTKACGECFQKKPLDEFNKHPHTVDGRQTYCRACCSERNRQRYEAKKESLKAAAAAYAEAIKEQKRQAYRANYPTLKDEKNARRRAKYAANPEPYKQASKAYREADPEGHRARSKAHYYANWDKNKLWRQANREYIRINSSNRRAQLRANGGRFTKKEWREKCAFLSWKCYLCAEQLTPDSVVIEHIIPVARGGTNSIDNVMPACAHCNHKKADRTLFEFLNGIRYVRGPKKRKKRAINETNEPQCSPLALPNSRPFVPN